MINVVVDLSHHNESVDFSALRGAGIAGVLHKATQGADYVDPTYAVRQSQARQAGLLWGAYHFGDGSDAPTQAAHFLATANAAPGDLLVLDVEQNTAGSSMSLAQAEAFVQAVFQRSGRWPGVYGSSYLKQLVAAATAASPLARCWLWVATYANRPLSLAPLWPAWTLWQYTDGASGPAPQSIAGVGNCDRDMYNGDLAGLQRWWGGG
ncbi:glycoside hydrolase family 25 protein [Tahibacter caeni]|uniref:glycoside hydrolase family 25 protein n=1 Tax=Tahibacter caeni TaxID=1453545 RepID=UPI0021487A4F|nr:glycoside hydrolase family 25 protein [Tahibacter caeni]